MARFDYIQTPLSGLMLVQRKLTEDNRGFLSRFYCRDEFEAHGMGDAVVQINHTLTRKMGTVRGLHFQSSPHTEAKLVSCLRGAIFDVAIDLRKSSPTFLQWHGELLSADNHKSLFIPEGYAHGFQALSDDCELIYLHTCEYHSESESGLNVNDPQLAIVWPQPITEISDRDRSHRFIDSKFEGVAV